MTLNILIAVVLFVLFILMTRYFDKLNKANKLNFGRLLLLILLIFSLFVTNEIIGIKVVKPITTLLFPPAPSIGVEPLYDTILIEGGKYIQVNYQNIGDTPIEDIFIDYSFGVDGKGEFKRARVTKGVLPTKGDAGYFQFKPKQDLDCDIDKGLNLTITTFKTRNNNSCYVSIEMHNSTACMLDNIRINFSSKQIERSFKYFYPVRLQGLQWSLNGETCQQNANISSDPNAYPVLVFFDTKSEITEAYYFCKTKVMPIDWCRNRNINITDFNSTHGFKLSGKMKELSTGKIIDSTFEWDLK